jgi:MSHA biogenesis protein MshI
MSHHINLYDPALLRQRHWLTAANLLFALVMVAVILLGWGAWARIQGGTLATETTALADQIAAARDESVALATQLANRKPDPKLELDLAAMKELLGVRLSIFTALGQGVAPNAGGYADYLRGLARQTIAGLWLTGFSVGVDGSRMEIRGRTLDPALLAEYIHRLNAEPAFRGHRFAALNLAVPAPAPGTAPADTAAVSAPPPFHEFALVPEIDPGPGRAGGKP